MDGEPVNVTGRIERITYRNQDNGYTVFQLATADDSITVVGIFPFLSQGDTVEVKGEYIVHPTYGPQLKASDCVQQAPSTAESILKYLSSGTVRGIGPVTARRIVERFGERSLEVIENSPDELCSVRGISREKAEILSDEYNKQYGMRDIMLFMSRYKVTPEEVMSIYRTFGERSVDVIKENPYILCCEDIGFSFLRADNIAASLDNTVRPEYRTAAGIEYVLRHNLANGHTCLPRDKTIETAARLLECDTDSVDSVCDSLIMSSRLVDRKINDRDFLFLPIFYSSEEYISARLAVMLKYSKPCVTDELEIDYAEDKLHIKYEEMQRKAIELSMQKSVMVLTGGPGTGKTTTLNGMIELFERNGLDIALAAPTGRAAQRMSELTGRDAKTVHRLLEVEWGDGDKQYFDRNEKNPLNCDVLIVDEMSMVDDLLFESILRALRLGSKLILVGDSDQLPSVAAGNVLRDIVDSGRIPCVCLKKIFRQAQKSLIVSNAHAIISGKQPDLNRRDADFFMIDCKSPSSSAVTVVDLYSRRLPQAYGFSPLNDIQVLCPSRKLELGTSSLNTLLQDKINPVINESKQLFHHGFYFREKDKVMQIKNNYDIMWERDNGEHSSGVFNGDIGFIEAIDTYSQLVSVRYDDRVATYYGDELSQLEPAYAITVHKSQGSEFDCVIIPIADVPSRLVYRNLLYTAVTRAKRMLIVVGDRRIVSRMVENDRKMLRYSGLRSFLEENADAQNF